MAMDEKPTGRWFRLRWTKLLLLWALLCWIISVYPFVIDDVKFVGGDARPSPRATLVGRFSTTDDASLVIWRVPNRRMNDEVRWPLATLFALLAWKLIRKADVARVIGLLTPRRSWFRLSTAIGFLLSVAWGYSCWPWLQTTYVEGRELARPGAWPQLPPGAEFVRRDTSYRVPRVGSGSNRSFDVCYWRIGARRVNPTLVWSSIAVGTIALYAFLAWKAACSMAERRHTSRATQAQDKWVFGRSSNRTSGAAE